MRRQFSVWIPGELPGRNESERAARADKFFGARLKKEHTRKVEMFCLRCKDIAWVPMRRYSVEIEFRCKNNHKDPDNVIAGIKYVLDGLQAARIVTGDRWANVLAIHPRWVLDKNHPGVNVRLEGD